MIANYFCTYFLYYVCCLIVERNHISDDLCYLEELTNGVTHDPNPESRHWPIVLFFAIVLGTPWIMRRLLQLANIDRKSHKDWQKGTTLSVWLVVIELRLINLFHVIGFFLYPSEITRRP